MSGAGKQQERDHNCIGIENVCCYPGCENNRKTKQFIVPTKRTEAFAWWERFVHAVGCLNRHCVLCSEWAKQIDSIGKSVATPPEAATLNAALDNARTHVMTEAEKEAQRQSWVRGEQAMGEGIAPEAAKPTSLKIAEDALISLSNMDNPPVMRQIAKGALARMKDAASPSPAAPRITMEGDTLCPDQTCVVCGWVNTPFRRDGQPTCTGCMNAAPQATQVGPDYTSSFTGETVRFFAPQGEPQPDNRVPFPGADNGPCSACGDGDTEQKYHKHVPKVDPEQRIQELERAIKYMIDECRGYRTLSAIEIGEAVLKQSGGRG